jgi:hypothetical protein
MSAPQAVPPPYGFLRSCIDKRFVEITRQAYEGFVRDSLHIPNFGPTSFWHEAYAGGSAKIPPGKPDPNDPTQDIRSDGEKYAYEHGARIFGWQAHLNKCGGLPDDSDAEIEALLLQAVEEKVAFYRTLPEQPTMHLMIVAYEDPDETPHVRITRFS